MVKLNSDQEQFWTGTFGDDYSLRKDDEQIIVSDTNLFSQALKSAPEINSIVELGCNIGNNLRALNRINPKFKLRGYEINKTAVDKVKKHNVAEIIHESITNPLDHSQTFDLSFTKGVLIHINPDLLHVAYENIYNLSHKYILLVEYYNPNPVSVTYRNNSDVLFKRDFAGEMIEKYHLKLINYGFVYHRDNYFSLDDMNWFLLSK